MSLTKIGSIGINTGIAFAGVTTIVTLNTANDALSIGATVNVGSGITLGASGDIFATGVSTFSGNLKVGSGVTISPDGDGFYTGVVTATTFSGALAASSLTGALPAISGANLTNLDASDLASGTVPTARLGSGTASSSTFLRGDSTFAAVTSTTINSNTNNYLITGTGTADTLQGESGLTYDGDTLTSDAAMRNIQAGANYVLIGSSNAGGVTLGLDGDSNGDGAGTDYAFIEHDSSGDLNIVADNPADASNIIFKTNSTSERLRINSSGQIGIGANNNSDYDASARNVLIASGGTTGITIKSGGSSYYGAIHFADGTSSAAEYRAGRLLYEHSTNSFLLYNANAFSLKIDGDGKVGIGENTPLAQLHIKPASNMSQLLLEQNNATDGYALFQDGPNGGHLKFMRHINGSETQKLLLRSDGGLCFGTDSAAANALDDYEEGTFSATITSGGTVSSFTHNKCSYIKIGRQVIFQMYLQFTGSGNGSVFKVGNLPFTASNYSTYGFGGANIVYQNNSFQATDVAGHVSNLGTDINFYKGDGNIMAGNGGNLFGGADFILIGQYQAG